MMPIWGGGGGELCTTVVKGLFLEPGAGFTKAP